MKLGFLLGYSGKQINIPMDLIRQAESMGYDSVWTAEAYGNDSITSAAWVLAQTEKIRVGTAIMQMPARTPAMAAMTAMSLDQLSGGRFIMGLGASGPQVVEGWHGVPYGKPVTRTKEYIQILLLLNKYSVRQIAKAICKALNHRIYCYCAVQQFLLTAEDYAFTTFSLAGRDHLRHIVVHQTSVADYRSLTQGGCHVKRA